MSDRIPLMRHGIAHVETYDVTLDELDGLARTGGDVGLDFQFAEFFATAAASFLIALETTKIDSQTVKSIFWFVVVGGFSAAGVFAIKWWRNRGSFHFLIDKIKERQIGPVGDEDEELQLAELDQLTSQKGDSPQ